MVESQPSKHEVLSSKLSTTKKKKTQSSLNVLANHKKKEKSK
jgi:hypothetical protein